MLARPGRICRSNNERRLIFTDQRFLCFYKVIYLYGSIMNSQFHQALFSFTNVKWLIVYAYECLVVSH